MQKENVHTLDEKGLALDQVNFTADFLYNINQRCKKDRISDLERRSTEDETELIYMFIMSLYNKLYGENGERKE